MNVGEVVRRHARWTPERTVVVWADEVTTYGHLDERSDRLLAALNDLGAHKGARVATLTDNCGRYVEVVAACAKGGLIVVPINPRLNAAEVGFIIDNSGASVLFASVTYREVITDTLATVATPPTVFYLDQDDGEAGYGRLVARGGEPAPVAVAPDDGLFISYTSGTTGTPKGALMTHHNLLMNAANVSYHFEMSPDAVVLVVMPQSTGGCNHHIVVPTLFVGGRMVIQDARNFASDRFMAAIRDHRVTHVQLVPTMIYRLLDFAEFDSYDCSSLKVIGYGSAPMSVERLREALERFGPIFIQVYGQTEAGSLAVCLSKRHHIEALENGAYHVLASSGRPINTVGLRIVDENGNDCPTGEMGEIALAGDAITQGYWNAPEATASALRNGWLFTGDMARIDPAGFVYLVDRKKDIIISGGMNISAREIEETIYRHPGVRECAVLAVPDAHWGEAVKAVVSVREGHSVTEAEIIGLCRAGLAAYKCPRSVDFVEEFPKSAMGKILKRELKKVYWRDHERMVN